jgi:hypothetical protein
MSFRLTRNGQTKSTNHVKGNEPVQEGVTQNGHDVSANGEQQKTAVQHDAGSAGTGGRKAVANNDTDVGQV